MPKSLKLNLMLLGVVGLILIGFFYVSSISKLKAQTNSTNLIGYAWNENIGWISFSSENVAATETVSTPIAPAAVVCTPASPLTQTLACPSGQTGSITQTRTSTCPGPTTSGWTTTSNTCQDIVWSDPAGGIQRWWDAAELGCELSGARLPTRAELAKFGFTDPKYASLFSNGVRYWTNETDGTKAWSSFIYNGKIESQYYPYGYVALSFCYHK